MNVQENIERYLHGRMNPEEKKAFEEEMTHDSNLAEDVTFQAQVTRYVKKNAKREALQGSLADIGADFFQDAPAKPLKTIHRRNFSWLILAAAVVALLLVARVMLRPSLYEQYANYPELSLTEKAVDGEVGIEEIETAFNSKDFTKAQSLLEQYSQAHPNDAQARLYIGLCAIELQQYARARAVLEPLAQEEGPFRDYAYWYAALSWLKQGNKAACREALKSLPEDSEFWEKSRALLKKL
jgi:tetratricopeptide (TPR) repeat protein